MCLQPVNEWADDESTSDCRRCQSEFGVFVRRHHCRYCGQLFCDACSDTRFPLASLERLNAASPEPVMDERVCMDCEMFLHAWRRCMQNPFEPDDFEDLQLQP